MSCRLAHVLVWGVSLILVGGACSSAESTQPESEPSSGTTAEAPAPDRTDDSRGRPTGPPSDVVAQLIETALQTEGQVSYRALTQRLGSPQHVQTEPIANQYVRDQVDTLRTLVYNGVKALVYDVTRDAKEFLVRLSLLDARYATPEGLRVGLSEERVLDKIGPPTRRDEAGENLIYQETEASPTSLIVRIREGRVARIDWEFHFT